MLFLWKKYRLAKREDFHKVYRYGKSVANHQFVLYYLPKTGQGEFRLGLSISKKVGNAVVRNRLRRVIKEIVRLNIDRITGGYDYIIIVRKPCAEMNYKELEKSLFHVFRKASFLKVKKS